MLIFLITFAKIVIQISIVSMVILLALKHQPSSATCYVFNMQASTIGRSVI